MKFAPVQIILDLPAIAPMLVILMINVAHAEEGSTLNTQYSTPTAQLMAVVGDSISAGFIANTISLTASDPYYTQISNFWPEENNSIISSNVLMNAHAARENIIDDNISISRELRTAFRSLRAPSVDTAIESISANHDMSESQPFSFVLWLAQLLNHKNTDSWASGKSIYSHFIRLQKYLESADPHADLQVKNFAFSGALTDDLARQAAEIVSEWNSGTYAKVTYVTVLIGANDSCSDQATGGVPDSEMANSLRAFFAKLSEIKQADPIHVLISSLPNIPAFGNPDITNHLLPSGWTCGYRDQQYCKPLVSWTTPDEYAQSVAVIQDKNSMLQSIATEMTASYPQFQIFYSDKLFRQSLVLGQLAEDCFHPNWYGQEAISDLLWLDQPWWH